MAKRGNNIYHRADGRWEGRYYCKGSHKYRSVYGKSYTETKEKLDKLRSEVLVPSVRCVLLVIDILKMWLEARRPSIKESSYAGYRHKLEKHLIPYFDKMKYNRLDLSGISKFITDKLTEGLSPKYISDMVIMVKSAARWAEITYNYANQVKNAKLPKKKTKEASFFSPAEQKKIISTVRAEHSNTGCGVMLTLFTGMRIGETCALKWADIDFDNNVLHISKTVQRIHLYGAESKTAVKVTAPKSETSVRDIPLPNFIMDVVYDPTSNANGVLAYNGLNGITDKNNYEYSRNAIENSDGTIDYTSKNNYTDKSSWVNSSKHYTPSISGSGYSTSSDSYNGNL